MIRTFFTAKAENLKAEEASLTERIKDRQSQKSKSIIEDPKYKDLMNSNYTTYRVNSPSEHSASKPKNNNGNYNSGRNNGRSTSSYNGQNTNYNSFSINLNNNFGTSFWIFYKKKLKFYSQKLQNRIGCTPEQNQ